MRALRPLRRWLVAARRLLLGVLRRLSFAAAVGDSVRAVSADIVALDAGRSLANLLLVQGAATRNVPPVDEVLAYFNYATSPFYAELPASALPAPTDAPLEVVRWLQHRQARPPSALELAADEARLELLRTVYEEARKLERSRKRGAPRWFAWGADADV